MMPPKIQEKPKRSSVRTGRRQLVLLSSTFLAVLLEKILLKKGAQAEEPNQFPT